MSCFYFRFAKFAGDDLWLPDGHRHGGAGNATVRQPLESGIMQGVAQGNGVRLCFGIKESAGSRTRLLSMVPVEIVR